MPELPRRRNLRVDDRDIQGVKNGIKALVYQSYTKINNLYGGDGQWPLMTELGTDIYLRGKNQGDVGLCDYYGLTPPTAMWHGCGTTATRRCSTSTCSSKRSTRRPFCRRGRKKKSQFKAEMYVMRALFLWIVTETWGDSYLPMTTDETEGTEARRSPRAKFYEEIIGALEAAIGLFPDTRTTESGRIDMPAAKALLARMYLYNEQWDEAADMASQVIGHYGLELCPRSKTCGPTTKPTTNSSGRRNSPRTTPSARPTATGRGMPCISTCFPGVQTMLKWTGYGGCQAIPDLLHGSVRPRRRQTLERPAPMGMVLQRPGQRPLGLPAQPVARIHRHGALPLPPDVLPLAEHKRMEKTFTVFDRNDMFDADGILQDRWTFIGMTKFLRPHPAGATCRSCRIAATRDPAGELYLIRCRGAYPEHDEPGSEGAPPRILPNCANAPSTTKKPEYEEAMKVTEEDMTLDFIRGTRPRALFGEWQRRLDPETLRQAHRPGEDLQPLGRKGQHQGVPRRTPHPADAVRRYARLDDPGTKRRILNT